LTGLAFFLLRFFFLKEESFCDVKYLVGPL